MSSFSCCLENAVHDCFYQDSLRFGPPPPSGHCLLPHLSFLAPVSHSSSDCSMQCRVSGRAGGEMGTLVRHTGVIMGTAL